MQLLIKNGLLLQSSGSFLQGHIGIDSGKIAALWYGALPPLYANTPSIDAKGFIVSPGLVDTHMHGGEGFNFNDEMAPWEILEKRLSSAGVTSVLATGESRTTEGILAFIGRVISLAAKNNANPVDIVGIHQEGPYINKSRKGCHWEECIRLADKKEIREILDAAGGFLKVWTLAPEFAENMAAIETMASSGVSVSIAHTEADYQTAVKAFRAGANRVTHTFNTMPVINHRYEGIISAAWEHKAFMELIADGLHVSPTIMRMFISATDPQRIVLVSDNNELSGMPAGEYLNNGHRYIIKDAQIRTADGNLSGSYSPLNRYAFNLTRSGYTAAAALITVTENPAKSIGIFDRKGSFYEGKDADIVIFDEQFEAMLTIKSGRIVYKAERFSG